MSANGNKASLHNFLVLVYLLLFTSLASGQVDSRTGQAIQLIRQYLSDSGAPGVSITIAQDGEVVLSEGFGFSDLENMVPVKPSETRFRVASIAKPMTLMAIGRLAEEGKIDFDVPVSHYLPELTRTEQPITIRQLAGHLGGIRHYEGDEFWSTKQYASVRDGLAIFLDNPIKHEPGTQFLYSSYGFNVLGAVVEAVSDDEFVSVMTELVFQRIGMKRTVADDPSAIVVGRARPYSVEDGILVNSASVNNTYKWPSGGFLSTTEDLVRFGVAHLQGEALSDSILDLFWTPQQTLDGRRTLAYNHSHDPEEVEYGMGWMIRKDNRGRTVIGHRGHAVGGSTEFGIYVESGLVYAISTNMDPVSDAFRSTAYDVADIFLSN
jgi:serine beta-lactamase-like protein LACTB